jgi:hypothetical protein
MIYEKDKSFPANRLSLGIFLLKKFYMEFHTSIESVQFMKHYSGIE